MANRVRTELRIDRDAHAGLKVLADEAGLSLNELVNGLCRWAAQYGQAGRPCAEHEGKVVVEDEPEYVWFGRAESEPITDRHGKVVGELPPEVLFDLDFKVGPTLRKRF